MPSILRKTWIIPVAAIVALVFRAATDAKFPLIPAAATTVVCALLVVESLRRARNHRNGDRRPLGLLLLVGGQSLVAASTFLDAPILRTAAIGIGTMISAVGLIQLTAHRLGGRPLITERESAIAAGGIGLMYYVLVSQPLASGTSDVVLTAINSFVAVVAFFTMIFVVWLLSLSRTAQSRYPIILLIASQLCLTAHVVKMSVNPDLGRLDVLGVIGLAAAAAAYIHPDAPLSLAPSVQMEPEVDVRRSVASFSVVLVGPVLVAADLITSADLSLPTITVGSSALSLLVAMHLLGLVRRWVAVEHQGQHDPLTNLPNRPLFFGRMELAIESARLRNVRFVTMFLDLDRFKAVNDTLGHDAGDELLRQVAHRLNEASTRVGPDLTVARLGGDEFAIIVPQVKDARHAHAIGRLFLDQFLQPYDVGLRDIYVTPSIGMAEYPKDGTTVEDLIENADTAMFEAKERGRNTVVAYSPDQRVPGAHRLEIEAALHRAIERNELELHFQPQVDVSTGKIFAVESLLRWVHPTLGQISPEKFVPVAEESSLIDQIGEWTIDEACRAAARWAEIGLPPINVAVNLSPRQFQKSTHLTEHVSRALRTTGLPPDRLELELTESLALEKPEEVNQTLSRFRDMGIRTAIDDFGVGHTGLDYLDRIEVDTLKIDRSFINRIGESGAPLVTAVISLAKGLNLDVIAEGVETRAQVNFLMSHGCRYMQGYLFSKPLTDAQLEQVLRNQMRRDTESAPAEIPEDPPLAAVDDEAA